MSTMLDILVIIIAAVFAFLGFRKGLASTVVSVVGSLVTALLTVFLSGPIAEAIYMGGFRNTIIEKVYDASRLLEQSGENDLTEKILQTMPKFVSNSLGNFGVTRNKLAIAGAAGAEKVEELFAPIIISFISVFVSIALFILLTIIIKIVSSFICRTIDDSCLDIVNRFFGGLIGLLEGMFIVIVVAFVVRIAVPHLKQVPQIISEETISQSTVFKGIYDSPVLTGIIGTTTKSPNIEAVE